MKNSIFRGISFHGIYEKTWKEFFKDLKNEIQNDNVFNGAAALAFYFMLAIFPAMIFLLSILPYLPINHLQQAILDFINQVIPGESAQLFTATVREIVSQRKGGLLSFGALTTLWAASNGMVAIMQQLNITYKVKEGRPFFKTRGTAIALTLSFGAILLSSFALIVLGGVIQSWIAEYISATLITLTLFAIARWAIIILTLMLAFSIIYYFGPDVEQRFQFISPGSVVGVTLFLLFTIVFKIYIEHFGDYNKTYGSIGAVIILMLWLNMIGLVVLIGSEINALIEHYSPFGKQRGEK